MPPPPVRTHPGEGRRPARLVPQAPGTMSIHTIDGLAGLILSVPVRRRHTGYARLDGAGWNHGTPP